MQNHRIIECAGAADLTQVQMLHRDLPSWGWDIKPDVDFLPLQSISGAQLEESSAPSPPSLPPELAVGTAQIITLERVAPFGYLEIF